MPKCLNVNVDLCKYLKLIENWKWIHFNQQETLVEGLQRSSTRRTFRESPYTKEDVVDL